MKKTILIDLDGVLNEYNGEFDNKYIPKIREGAKEFLINLSKKFIVKIFTTRDPIQVKQWVIENSIKDLISGVTNIKEPSFLIIDDRCLNFYGNYEQTLSEINNFKVWYK